MITWGVFDFLSPVSVFTPSCAGAEIHTPLQIPSRSLVLTALTCANNRCTHSLPWSGASCTHNATGYGSPGRGSVSTNRATAVKRINIRATEADFELLTSAARDARMSLSRFVLTHALSAARGEVVRTDTPTPEDKELVGTSVVRETPEKVQQVPAQEPPVDDEPEGYYDEDGDWVINRPARRRRGWAR